VDLVQAIAARRAQFLVQREAEGIQSLIQHSQAHIDEGTVRKNKDGTVTTVFTIGVQDKRLNDGRETIIPKFWNGKEVSHKEAVEFALQSGKTWPSGDSIEEAHAVDQYAHSFINKQEIK